VKLVPRKKGLDVATIIVYIILAIVFSKLFGIIPDPPEIDVNVIAGLLGVGVGISTGIASWLNDAFPRSMIPLSLYPRTHKLFQRKCY
jgi:hypothetical protein